MPVSDDESRPFRPKLRAGARFGAEAAQRPILMFEDVYKSYRPGAPVLRGMNLIIERGEFVFITGPSGSGKSTLLRLLVSRRDGRRRAHPLPRSRHRAPHARTRSRSCAATSASSSRTSSSSTSWTVFENVAITLEVLGLPPRLIRSRVGEALERVGLARARQRSRGRALRRRAAARRGRARDRRRAGAHPRRRADRQPRSAARDRHPRPLRGDPRDGHDRALRDARSLAARRAPAPPHRARRGQGDRRPHGRRDSENERRLSTTSSRSDSEIDHARWFDRHDAPGPARHAVASGASTRSASSRSPSRSSASARRSSW